MSPHDEDIICSYLARQRMLVHNYGRVYLAAFRSGHDDKPDHRRSNDLDQGRPTVQLSLAAKNIVFDQSSLSVLAGSTVVLIFDNQDAGVPHNFAFYTDSSAMNKIFIGSIVTGPNSVTYTFTAPTTKGTYYFRCDVLPTIMYGSFIVT